MGKPVINSLRKSVLESFSVAPVVALLVPIAFPIVHMILFSYLWGDMTYMVQRNSCTCSCWDTIFKGPYESGVARYKHVYFNSTGNTAKIWIMTVIAIVAMYECFKKIVKLILVRQLRLSMLVLFISSLHSHYYGWWMHWNYWNDEFYPMWDHQVFFTVTELLSTTLVVIHLDRRVGIEPLGMLIVGNVAAFHVVSSGADQFLYNLVFKHGKLHQVMRDIALMSADIIQVTLPLYELRKYTKEHGVSFMSLLFRKEYFSTLLLTTGLMYLYVTIYP